MYRGIEFFTATCLNWQPLLLPDDRKDILMDSLNFMVNDKRIWLYGFVIMPNHINLMWRRQDAWLEKRTEQLFLKCTAQQINFRLIESSPGRWSNTAARKATGYPFLGEAALQDHDVQPQSGASKIRLDDLRVCVAGENTDQKLNVSRHCVLYSGFLVCKTTVAGGRLQH